MKKLYFLNEEESKRILNLHKDATKRQYLSEELPFTSVDIASTKTPIDSKSFNYQDYNTPTNDVYDGWFGSTKTNTITPTNTVTPTNTSPASTTPPPAKSTGYVDKPLVTKIQQSLKEKGINLGASGPNKDGIDGILGKLTLNGIVSALGGGTTVAGTTKTETQPENMSKKEVTTVQEPNATPELKTSTPSSGIASNDTAENSIDPV
jgi:hypothetical protein